MKILLREHRCKMYAWHDATYDDALNFRVDGKYVRGNNVVSVIDDDATKYVRCPECNSIFVADSEEAKAHVSRQFKITNCYQCKHLRVYDRISSGQEFIPMPNGKFLYTQTGEAELRCGAAYPTSNITSPDMPNKCPMMLCNGVALQPVETFFTKYPGAFETIITVDKLLECGLQEEANGRFPIKGRNKLYARVNDLGIVDCFYLLYHNQSCDLYYSKKYKKCFYANGQGYTPLQDNSHIPYETATYIIKKIEALYDGIEVTNE